MIRQLAMAATSAHASQLDLIAYALKSKKADFSKASTCAAISRIFSCLRNT